MNQWQANWIGPAFDPRQDLGVFAYRVEIDLESVPSDLPIRISADNRYKLYVNGEMVAFGPQRGDARHWFFETIDLASYLRKGRNVLVALVWNFGWMAPMAQHMVRTAFVCDCEPIEALRTPGEWRVARLSDWGFDMMHTSVGHFYIDIGPGEIIGPGLLPPRTDELSLEWREPHVISHAEDRAYGGGGTPWMLIPRSIPPMRYELRPDAPKIRHGFVGDSAPGEPETLIEAGRVSQGKLLLDYGELLCAYPRLRISGPEGAAVTLTYAEAMWAPDGSKGNRDAVAGKEMRGYQDKLILGAGPSSYEPLWWRTYRYLMIDSHQPVTLERVDAIETGYPLQVESSFEADDRSVEPIWDVSVRTAKRCAGETYFDCPYYEQLQYAGDTRVQALIGYYVGRDRHLQRNAIENLGWSIMENGLTQSRYPSRQTQVIPPFSLWWVMMLYDQMLYDEDLAMSSERALGAELNAEGAFARNMYRTPLRNGEFFWNFGDWVPNWRAGVPPGGIQSTMHELTNELASVANSFCALSGVHKWARVQRDLLAEWEPIRARLLTLDGLTKWQFDPSWGPSEHSEAIVRCIQMLVGREVDPWPTEALAKANAARCTYYFSYYKHLAMFGREDAPFDYMEELKPWKEMIEDGLSTFAENPEPTRSDCHAWSAHPILGFFQIVAGVTSVAPAWKRAKIAPKPGSLKHFDARIAHPKGELRVAYEMDRLHIDTPVPAELIWRGKKIKIKPGRFDA